jgi:hypothetical protein
MLPSEVISQPAFAWLKEAICLRTSYTINNVLGYSFYWDQNVTPYLNIREDFKPPESRMSWIFDLRYPCIRKDLGLPPEEDEGSIPEVAKTNDICFKESCLL